jgi:putative spermidine/putrescine transport system ATP-binding protein
VNLDHNSIEPDTVLRLRGVTKRFGSVVAVNQADLSVQRNEILTLLGPSGSGKTTILKMVAGFERPSSGTILLEGINAVPLSPAERRIGFVFQHHALFPHLTVGENIRYPLKRQRWSRSDQDLRVNEMLALIQLPGFEKRYPRQLSGGQQQRVALARALAFRPRFLLMDEPLGALDRALRFELAEEIRRIHRETGATIIYVTHDQEEALTLSDRIAVMRRGRIVQIGKPKQLYEQPAESFIAEFLGECNLLTVDACTMLDDDRAEVTLLGQRFVVSACCEPGLENEATLVVRPRQLEINPEESAARLCVRIVELLYLGEVVRVHFRMKNGAELLARVDARSAGNLRIGDEVDVGFSPSSAVLVPRTEPPTSQELQRIVGRQEQDV